MLPTRQWFATPSSHLHCTRFCSCARPSCYFIPRQRAKTRCQKFLVVLAFRRNKLCMMPLLLNVHLPGLQPAGCIVIKTDSNAVDKLSGSSDRPLLGHNNIFHQRQVAAPGSEPAASRNQPAPPTTGEASRKVDLDSWESNLFPSPPGKAELEL